MSVCLLTTNDSICMSINSCLYHGRKVYSTDLYNMGRSGVLGLTVFDLASFVSAPS